MAVVGDPSLQFRLAGITAFCLGGLAVSMTRDALAAGRIRFQFTLIRKAQRPRLFAATAAFVAAAGVACMVLGVWMLFSSPPPPP